MVKTIKYKSYAFYLKNNSLV